MQARFNANRRRILVRDFLQYTRLPNPSLLMNRKTEIGEMRRKRTGRTPKATDVFTPRTNNKKPSSKPKTRQYLWTVARRLLHPHSSFANLLRDSKGIEE